MCARLKENITCKSGKRPNPTIIMIPTHYLPADIGELTEENQ